MIYEMKVIRRVEKNNWDFSLFHTDEGYVLNVVFHASFSDFSRSFRVKKEEIQIDFEGLKEFSEEIRNNYDLYKHREVTPVVRYKE
jgi:hypothetical protein